MEPTHPRRTGHWPTILCAFLYFETSFLAWVLLVALGDVLADAFQLASGQKGLLIALPILGGALLQPVFGILSDRYQARKIALYGLSLTALPLLFGAFWANSLPHLLLVGLLLGVSGASFAVALPLVSRWYPSEHQGLILGITGMGSSGTALLALCGPWLVSLVGWRGVFGLVLIPVAIVLALVALIAREGPAPASSHSRSGDPPLLRIRDIYRFCGFYAVTFGGFLGLTSFVPIFYREQYGVDPTRAAIFAGICAVVGALLRPVGGFLADRLGAVMMLFLVFLGMGFLGMRMSYVPPLEVATLCMCLMLVLLGMGNGAVLQLVPLRFRTRIGEAVGLVGAAGILAGVLLPLCLTYSHQSTGRFGPGFFLIGLVGFLAAGLLIQASRHWNALVEPLPRRSTSGLPLRERSALSEVAIEAIPR